MKREYEYRFLYIEDEDPRNHGFVTCEKCHRFFRIDKGIETSKGFECFECKAKTDSITIQM